MDYNHKSKTMNILFNPKALKETNNQLVNQSHHAYQVEVIYNENYFDNPEEPREKTLYFGSMNPRTWDYIQNVYRHCKITSIIKVK